MPTNPVFNTTIFSSPTQNLMQDLTDQLIQMHGQDMYYLPRILLAEDQLFGESAQCLYRQAISIEMMFESVQGFEGDQDIISKFGFAAEDSLTLVVSRRRFASEITNLPEPVDTKLPPQDPIIAPREGDLSYIPNQTIQSLWEIKFVEKDQPFSQLGERYSFKLKIERYKNSHAFFMTGVPDIDRINAIRKKNNEGNDIRKDVNQDNVVIRMEADGADNNFVNETKVQTDKDGKVVGVSRGEGLTNFGEGNAILNDIENY